MNILEQSPDSSILNEIILNLKKYEYQLSLEEIENLILSIGNILVNHLITQNQNDNFECSEKLGNYIKLFLENNKNNTNRNLTIDIFHDYLKAKMLFLGFYLNY